MSPSRFISRASGRATKPFIVRDTPQSLRIGSQVVNGKQQLVVSRQYIAAIVIASP